MSLFFAGFMQKRCLIAVLACLMAGGMARGEGPVISHADSFSKQGLVMVDAANLKDTHLVAHPDVRLHYTQNVIWCGTLQLTWNKAMGLVGEKLHFDHQSSLADQLNREDFTTADLNSSSYVAVADFEKNDVPKQIRTALKKTFHGQASPELIPETSSHPGPDDFMAYAYLYKNLPFPKPFQNNDPLMFQGTKVANFGFNMNGNDGVPSDELCRQVEILSYKSRNDFVIKLHIQHPEDELILAKILPGTTLQETILRVQTRIAEGTPILATSEDTLAIPKLNLDMGGHFPELEGLRLRPGEKARIKRNLVLKSVEQLIRFQLSETGAILKSEASIGIGDSGINYLGLSSHHLIFDRPFLILMKQANSKKPYFVFWVGNASLLVAASATHGTK